LMVPPSAHGAYTSDFDRVHFFRRDCCCVKLFHQTFDFDRIDVGNNQANIVSVKQRCQVIANVAAALERNGLPN